MSNAAALQCRISRWADTGAAIYKDYRDNFVIWPGREDELENFVKPPYKARHKMSSNSEDALTWSCFDVLNELRGKPRTRAFADLWALAFRDRPAPAGFPKGKILIGRKYVQGPEETEIDASVEGDKVLVFIEAKLYSPITPADPDNRKPHDQIARKLRVGLKEAKQSGREFFFIILDIAPKETLQQLKPHESPVDDDRKPRGGFAGKWLTADLFSGYKGLCGNVSPLHEALKDIPGADAEAVAKNMGWLTWPDVFKAVLRAVIESRQPWEAVVAERRKFVPPVR